MLQLKNIIKKYKTGGNDVEVLKSVNISFRESEFVSILGASGSGKTTLLNPGKIATLAKVAIVTSTK